MNFPDSELWSFSNQTYKLPEVEGACLELQNNFDADINIILYCLWVAEKGIKLTAEDVMVLIQTTLPWQKSILKPLRDARKMMKQHIIAMPSELLDLTVSNLGEMELNAEHMSQLALEKIIDIEEEANMEPAVDCATLNTSTYLQQLESVSSVSDVTEHLSKLLNAVYQDAEAVQVSLMELQ
jgi:uncharacterized protein (TIGR02444 family)